MTQPTPKPQVRKEKILYVFKAKEQTRRFRKNQKVFITALFTKHARIRYKWRGSGRWVSGVINKSSPCSWGNKRDFCRCGFL